VNVEGSPILSCIVCTIFCIPQVRTVILIALLAIVRKLILVDPSATDAAEIFALAAAILALGGVYWLVRDQDRREQA
jgi:uncharacterized membrane protein (DUF373 family)